MLQLLQQLLQQLRALIRANANADMRVAVQDDMALVPATLEQLPLDEFDAQQLRKFERVIPISDCVCPDRAFNCLTFKVRTLQCSLIEQDFTNSSSQFVSKPGAEMVEAIAANEQSLSRHGTQRMG